VFGVVSAAAYFINFSKVSKTEQRRTFEWLHPGPITAHHGILR
jgi:hypothetical protein